MSAYLIGFIVMVVSLFLAMILTNSVKESANRNTKTPRRLRFWVMAILTPVITALVAYFMFYKGIKVPSKQTDYMTAMAISAGLFFVLQILFGFLFSKTNMFDKRLQSWF